MSRLLRRGLGVAALVTVVAATALAVAACGGGSTGAATVAPRTVRDDLFADVIAYTTKGEMAAHEALILAMIESLTYPPS